MKRCILCAAGALAIAVLATVAPADTNDDVAMGKQTIKSAYVEGIHMNRDIPAIRKGFHPEFIMFGIKDGEVTKTSIDEWIGWIEESLEKDPDRKMPKTEHKFTSVEVAGEAASARIEIYKDGTHVFTDFMSLYRFDDGWKIVAKTYYRHPK
jgi:hypothetical protein